MRAVYINVEGGCRQSHFSLRNGFIRGCAVDEPQEIGGAQWSERSHGNQSKRSCSCDRGNLGSRDVRDDRDVRSLRKIQDFGVDTVCDQCMIVSEERGTENIRIRNISAQCCGMFWITHVE